MDDSNKAAHSDELALPDVVGCPKGVDDDSPFRLGDLGSRTLLQNFFYFDSTSIGLGQMFFDEHSKIEQHSPKVVLVCCLHYE